MHKKKRASSAAALLAIIVAVFGTGNVNLSAAVAATTNAGTQGQAGIDFVESYTPTNTKSQYVSPIKPYDEAATVRPKAITLAAMPAHELAKKTLAPAIGQPAQISVPREVAETATIPKTASRMQWTSSAQGNHIGSIRIKSIGAKGVFIGVLIDQLPPSAMLRFHGDKSTTAFHVSAAEILTRIQTNVNAGDKTNFGRTYWAPPLDSDDVTMEIELPVGISTDALQISIPLISHVFTTSAELDKKAKTLAKTGAGTCNVDATCYPEYDSESRSVARILFVVSPGAGASCTGTLLNNRFSDGIPYFLTANHCISTQTQASNLYQIDWLYRSSACDSGIQSTPKYQTSGGAVLLYGDIYLQTDTTFLRLNSPPPPVARFAAWSAEPVSIGTAALGLHNPRGNLQEASLGIASSYQRCTTSNPDTGFSCFSDVVATANHIEATWSAGSDAPGSSGSGLFITKNNARYLVGQLHGGGACTGTFSATRDYYGRFDRPYKAALYQWLSPRRPVDLSGDGKSDLLVQSSTGTTTAWLMNGTTISSSTNLLTNDPNWTISHTADFNGDGKVDILWRNTNGAVTLWLMNGSTVTSAVGLLGPNTDWRVSHVADFNGDGNADLLWRNTNGAVTMWLMNGTAISSATGILGADANWSVSHIADFNGDGKADLLWRKTDGAVTIWLMDGTTISSSAGVLGADANWRVSHTGDFNGDGKADLLWRNTNGAATIWLMNGTVISSTAGILGADANWSVSHIGDFNGDGKADLLWRNTNGAVTMWLMNGTTTSSTAGLIGADPNWRVSHLVDLNGDGKADLIWRHLNGSITAWMMNGTVASATAGLTGAGTWRVAP
jgi:FG-GAP-like repeat/Trypsin